MENIDLDIIFTASELSQARDFFREIRFDQERAEFDTFETMIFEGNMTIYKQISLKLLQSFRILSKSMISQVRNFSSSPQNLALVFVKLSSLLGTAPLAPPETTEKMILYSDFLKVFVYKTSLESKKDEMPIFERVLELTLDLVLYGGFEANFSSVLMTSSLPNPTQPAAAPASLSTTSSQVKATSSPSSSSPSSSSSMTSSLTLLAPDDIVEPQQQQYMDTNSAKKNTSSMFLSPDDL